MKTNTLLALLLALSFTWNAEAQEKEIEKEIAKNAQNIDMLVVDSQSPFIKNESSDCEEPNKGLIKLAKHIVQDTGAILVAPAGWSKEEWIKASAIVAGIVLLSTQDDEIKNFAQSIRTNTTDSISTQFERLGNGATVLPLMGATYALSVLIKNDKLQNTTSTALESATVAAVLTTMGKYLFHRTRPDSALNQYQISGPSFTNPDVSFPSGHTGTAFAIATVFAEAYGDNKIIPILAYSAATLVGLSRIHDNKHWASDTAMGAVLGYATGKFISNRRLNKNSPVQITPSFGFINGPEVNVSVKISLDSKKRKPARTSY